MGWHRSALIEVTTEIRDQLAKLPLLEGMSEEDLDEGLADCHLVEVPSGRKIVEQGEYDDTCFILISGQCLVVRKSVYKSGKTLKALIGGSTTMGHTMGSEPGVVGHLVAGDFFGELSVMSPWPRTSTVITSVDSLVLQITSEVFERWMEVSETFRATMDDAYMTRGLKTILKSLDAFAPLSDDEMARLIEGATGEKYKKGKAIVTEGDDADAFYLIRGGLVSVEKQFGEVRKTVSYLRAGNYFGEMALLHAQPRAATVVACNSVEVVRLDRARFEEVIQHNEAAVAALRVTVAQRLRTGQAVLSDDRVADALDFIAGEGILQGSDVLVVDLGKCIHCGNCEKACESTHDVSLITLHGPTHKAFLFPTACRNCDDPLCLQKCPVLSITRNKQGEVEIHDHCIGCGKCAQLCPYDTISLVKITADVAKFAQERAGLKKQPTRQAIKCDLCEGIDSGAQCVASCPTAAIYRLGPRELVKHVLRDGAGG